MPGELLDYCILRSGWFFSINRMNAEHCVNDDPGMNVSNDSMIDLILVYSHSDPLPLELRIWDSGLYVVPRPFSR